MKKKMAGIALAGAAALALSACSSSTTSPAPAETSAMETPMASEAAAGTLVEVAAGNPDFSTLVTAVQAAGLTETLSAEGPYTVFAPTNEAFAALPPKVVKKLLKPENKETLTKVLTYHVLPEELTSDEITAGKFKTVEGQDVTITTDGGVKVDGATVVTADVMASNGVVHAIDAVILPPGVDVSQL